MIRTATTALEVAHQHHQQHIDSTGSAITPTQPEHRFKNRLSKFIRIPPSVAQTHSRMIPIRLGINRVEKKKLAPVTVLNSPIATTTATGALDSNASTDTDEKSPELLSPAATDSSLLTLNTPDTIHMDYQTCSQMDSSSGSGSSTEHDSDETDLMVSPREGFTVSYSLFAKVKARVLQQSSPQQQQQQQQQQHHKKHIVEDINGNSVSCLEKGQLDLVGKDSNYNQIDFDSNSSPNTLSAGTSGDLLDSNSKRSLIGLGISSNHHPHVDIINDPSNDSDSTVTDLEKTKTRLHHRKYSFNSQRSNSYPEDETAVAAPTPAPVVMDKTVVTSPSPALTPALTESKARVVIADPPERAKDPVELFEQVFHRQHLTEEAISASLQELRQLILAYGIPDEKATTSISQKVKRPSIRSRCWKLLLEVHHVSAQEYVSLVKRGKPEEYDKIRNDTFRTLATDRKFRDAVVEESLIRVLCAFSWNTQATSVQDTGVSFTYVQGMNVLAAPFLYAMTEMEAFYAYSNFIKYCCPLYVQPTLQGVHCGIKLLEECLCKIDVELYNDLKAKKLSAELYAFPSILTICACTPPLDQAMQLWDFLLAWGIHLNIICIIAQLHLIRDELMSHASPMKLLRIFPDLDADKIIHETIRMVKLLPDELYDLLVRHPYDPTVAEQIGW
ncbi:hypothetical protein BG011_006626 [Mortierella polycephala]|uniref:Rab-GAP TBC domain-containing protein n=1 Tax=Mortierella polycephala TaxID=41804 RepID=A0A9P6PVI5_9FUNG|nr:hypothetical protein BG011_006626 [Mortierella polycephala]